MVLPEKQHKTLQEKRTPLELFLLTVVSQQRALRIDHVPRFLALFEASSDHGQSIGRNMGAQYLVERLRNAGLLHLRHLRENGHGWIWLTSKGWQAIGSASTHPHPPLSRLPVLHAANTLRLRLTEQNRQLRWISHQQLRRAAIPHRWSPLPTAELMTSTGERIALHIVFHQTGTREQIMARFSEQLERETSPGIPSYTALWYYASAPAAQRLRAARAGIAEEVGKAVARKIGIFSYPLLPTQRIYCRHQASVEALAWSHDGAWIAEAGGDLVQVWEATTGKEQFQFAIQTPASRLSWSRKGSWIALLDQEGRLSVWEGAPGQIHPIPLDHPDRVTDLAWSPTIDQKLATCSVSGRLQVYDMRQQALLWESSHLHSAQSLAWSPDGTCLAVGGHDPCVSLFDATTGRLLRTYKKHHAAVRALAWSPDSSLLASTSDDPVIVIWEATTGKRRRTIKSHLSTLRHLAWSPDGTRLACAGSDPCVQVWEVQSGRLLQSYLDHAETITGLAWSPDSSLLASASEDGTVQVYTAARGSR